jgi:4-hydroxythreonine-4-phosphate dehydrogenase
MGDPVGIGPEITLLALNNPSIYEACKPLVLGDVRRLEAAKKCTGIFLDLASVETPETGRFRHGCVDVMNLSDLDPDKTSWGKPDTATGKAMMRYIITAVALAINGRISAIVTCPINKTAMHMAGFHYNGHTELLAEQTKSDQRAMMLAGEKLRVVLVTIHIPLRDVPAALSEGLILDTIRMTGDALQKRFHVKDPRIAVAGLNPHAGEGGIFGDEEENVIAPAVRRAETEGFNVTGPCPPDTLFYHAVNGGYDAVVCMYHDQGLIPFKMIHFTNGVNVTLGLPIIRTSVDHGTAYDIAGTGKADPGSLVAAIRMASSQAICLSRKP